METQKRQKRDCKQKGPQTKSSQMRPNQSTLNEQQGQQRGHSHANTHKVHICDIRRVAGAVHLRGFLGRIHRGSRRRIHRRIRSRNIALVGHIQTAAPTLNPNTTPPRASFHKSESHQTGPDTAPCYCYSRTPTPPHSDSPTHQTPHSPHCGCHSSSYTHSTASSPPRNTRHSPYSHSPNNSHRPWIGPPKCGIHGPHTCTYSLPRECPRPTRPAPP